ncbi:MMPL family transporter [Streptomyces nodosus]|uniref:MMPL family transporter n=1 Tax=Streptomyces nodosus TaxID=40318 RepID=UPI0037F7B498
MSTFLFRVGRFSYRRRWVVIVAWLVMLITAAAAGLTLAKPFESTVTIPGTEAQRTLDALAERFPSSRQHATGTIVVQAPKGKTVTTAAVYQVVDGVVGKARDVEGVTTVTAPSTSGGSVSADGTIGVITLGFKAKSNAEVSTTTRTALEEIADHAREEGVTAELGGAAAPKASGEHPAGQTIGILATLLILVLVFRSLRAAVIPFATAMVSVGLGLLLLLTASHFVTLQGTSMTLASMLGLAVGVDYALFIMSRHQKQVRSGVDPADSAGLAVGKAGSAVVFAGATVVVALAALTVVNIPFLTVMGLAAAATVLIAVLVALTLVPAVLGLLGHRIASSRLPFLRSSSKRRTKPTTLGMRWARVATRLRVPVLLLSLAGLGALAVPAASLQLGLTQSQGEALRAQRLIDEGFGPGYSSTLVVLVEGSPGTAVPAAEQLTTKIRALADVGSVSAPQPDGAKDAAVVTVTPDSGPDDARTKQLLSGIRQARGSVERATNTKIGVTGTTAVSIDVSDKLSGALPVYCAIVLGLAVMLLAIVFRSIAVPLKAAVGFLLSMAATLGFVVGIFQWGWLASLLGTETTGPVISFVPILLVGVLFGLAMDYEIFLVSRMREEYTHGRPAAEAMQHGFAKGSKVVTAAALIMVSVFAGTAVAGSGSTTGIGLGLAAGVLFDAFVVRMAMVPAMMAFLGDGAWWMPRFLRRILPDVDVEGERLTHRFAAAHSHGTQQPAGQSATPGEPVR